MVGQDPLYGEAVRQPLEALRRQCIKIGSMGWDARGEWNLQDLETGEEWGDS